MTRVLVVDDEPDLCAILREDLEYAGFEVITADGGHRAVEVLKTNPPVDAILSDIRMPRGNGIELVDAVAGGAAGYALPVVFLFTGFADLSVCEAYAKGVTAVFHKPADAEELVKHLHLALMPAAQRWRQPPPAAQPKSVLAAKVASPSLGQGGFFAPLPASFPATGELVRLDVTVSDAPIALKGVGVVRWVRKTAANDQPAGVGVEITHLDEASCTALVGHLSGKSTRAFIPLV